MGFTKRLSYAVRTFLGILTSGKIPEDVVHELVTIPAAAFPKPVSTSFSKSVKQEDSCDRAVQMLALLQRDGRLIDFFTEDISPYPDAQIGAGVRDVHQNCRQSLERYLKLEAVIEKEEGQTVTVQEGMDPAAVKLIGHGAGTLPVSGVLRHRGWRVTSIHLPPLSEGTSRSVIAPAEIETQ